MDLCNLVSIFYLLFSIYPERVEGWSFACDSRRCLLHRSGALQLVNTSTSRSVGHVIYHILCAHPKYYVGSTKDFKVRWSNHKPGCRNGRWANCGLTKHFGQHHRDEMEVAIAEPQGDLLLSSYRQLQGGKAAPVRNGLDRQDGDLWADRTQHQKSAAQSAKKELGSRPLV